jgi:outer membrane protein assembly factor BamA
MSACNVTRDLTLTFMLLLAMGGGNHAHAQAPPAESRTALIEQTQAEKATRVQPYVPSKAEKFVTKLEDQFLGGQLHWHPFFESAYAGGGFTLGAGWKDYVSAYNTIDLRGSYTFSNYKRIEAEFRAPRLFKRRGSLSVLGGWREATQVGFYGFGTANTSKDDRANYSFQQPYASATLTVWPTRRLLVLTGELEYSQWKQREGHGSFPSVEEVYTPATLPGLGASPTYLHTVGTVALDWRDAPDYSRRGGYYGVTVHDFSDQDDDFGFRQVDYEAIQHLPILRDAWVLSLRGRVETTYTKDDQAIPFFMQPALGGGSSLRGFASWRFRDRHSLLVSADWRVLVNRFFDTALFYDAGKVVSRTSDLDFDGLKSDYGIGFRLHGPTATPLRIELAKSNEGLQIVFAAHAAF